MLFSLGLIFIVGFSAAEIFRRIKLPRIIGILAAGMIIGPYVLDLLDPSILGISAELRKMSLIIILIKAGLSLDLSDLKKIGRPAVLMSFLPAAFEITGYVIFAPIIFGISRSEAAVMGAVLSAVSPAVVVPRMVKLIEEKRGTKTGVPQLILAGASCDDIFVIVLISAFLTMAQSGSFNAASLWDIPISIILGAALGAIAGAMLGKIFSSANIRSTTQTIILLSSAFMLMTIETWAKDHIALSGLLAVVSMACVLKLRTSSEQTKKLSAKFGKLWIAAECLLFALVGAAVDIRYTMAAGMGAIAIIFISLCFRTVGVILCLVKTKLSIKERIFCIIAYLPKATVQAAFGAVPLAAGLPGGKMILSVAVLAIIITAPLGAIGIDNSFAKLLSDDSE
ncbi:MAG: cation:proton antiporter [Oscillospiraceae bacterium]|nr:cation:proton antiporter [Oscillospiraceae bacterium]